MNILSPDWFPCFIAMADFQKSGHPLTVSKGFLHLRLAIPEDGLPGDDALAAKPREMDHERVDRLGLAYGTTAFRTNGEGELRGWL
jgi:hypothetical protein